MFLLRPPTPAQTEQFLTAQRALKATSYRELCATREGQCPVGYLSDQHRFVLGAGEACFRRAVAALRSWQVFETPWVTLLNPDAPFEVGATLALLVRHLGFYSLIGNRVVYLLDEERRVGFGYGTLEGHAFAGEERFVVDWLPTDEVVFELFAFSRPALPLARVGQPVVRRFQAAGAAQYGAAMVRAVQGPEASPHDPDGGSASSMP